MKKYLSIIKQWVFHKLSLYPIYRVLDTINKHYPLKACDALEAFAHTGAWQARAYRQYPKYHEAWEIKEECREPLKRNLPKAVIKITNSFEEIQTSTHKFNFINVDTHQGIFDVYCENFEFFPLLFRVAQDECIVNLNVIPNASDYWRKKYGSLFSQEHLKRRSEFYKTNKPEDVSLETMLKIYGEIASKNNYKIAWHHYQQRTLTYYLVLHLKKVTA